MEQWVAEIAYETVSGTKTVKETYYLPTEADVREAVSKEGGYILAIRQHKRSPFERLMAKSTSFQIRLLRGIQFRSHSESPGVALWKIIQSETNPRTQNIMAPAREALARGLGIIDALKALNTFDPGTLAILGGSERANKLVEGIPYAVQAITQKSKNKKAIIATVGWLGFDIFSIVSSLASGKDMVLGYFRENTPKDPDELEKFMNVVNNLELTWDVLIWFAYGMGGLMGWVIFSYWINSGKKDWPTARFVRSIPLIGGYLQDLAFADSMSAAARMLQGMVPINEALSQSAEASTDPGVTMYWLNAKEDLERGISLGAALDSKPLTRPERMELATLSDLQQVATIMESIAIMREDAAKSKHKMILFFAFLLTGVFLALAFGSAIFGLSVMNMSMDSMMGGLMEGAM